MIYHRDTLNRSFIAYSQLTPILTEVNQALRRNLLAWKATVGHFRQKHMGCNWLASLADGAVEMEYYPACHPENQLHFLCQTSSCQVLMAEVGVIRAR